MTVISIDFHPRGVHDTAMMHALKIWLRAFRLHYVPSSILSAILGSVMAWSHYHTFRPLEFFLVLAGVCLNHIGLNMIDDVYDYRNAVDRKTQSDKNPYTGGSGILTEGLLAPYQMLTGACICFAVTALIGFYLAYRCGWGIVLLGVIGLASSLFYTAPPIQFGYRGYGELGLFVNFGPVLVLGSYYAQVPVFHFNAFMISLIPGALMWSMIMINEIPDYDDDRRGGKWTLVARYGRETGVLFYTAGLSAAYFLIVVSVIFNLAGPYFLLALVTVPMAFASLKMIRMNDPYPQRLGAANRTMLYIHAVTLTMMILSYIPGIVANAQIS
jgi:1,4-dihydroxy-2-naphthoate octaprenyltransferase